MFSLTAASSLVPNAVRDARLDGRRASRRVAARGGGEIFAFFDLFFPKNKEKKKKTMRKTVSTKRMTEAEAPPPLPAPPPPAAPPPPKPVLDWKAKFDEAVEMYSIDEIAMECAFMENDGDCGDAVETALNALGKHADIEEKVAAMTRKLITAGGSTAAYAVETWALDHADSKYGSTLFNIAGSYDFVTEDERVELLNNTVAYYVRDTSKECCDGFGDGQACVDTVEAALSFLSYDDSAEAERVANDLIGAGGMVAVNAISEWCRQHPEQPHLMLLESIAEAERSKLSSPV